MRSKLTDYFLLMRADKPIGTLLLLWPTLSSFFLLTEGSPTKHLIIVFLVGTFLMRSAGCVINDYFDRDFDGKVNRTKNRPIATGRVSSLEALSLFLFLVALSALLLCWTNFFTFLMAVLGLVIAIIYPLSKRFFAFPQLFLGAAFSWGIIMVSSAENGAISDTSIISFLACFFWIQAYDTEYAMCDKEDDLSIGIGSSAIFLKENVQFFVILFHLISLILWGLVGFMIGVSWFFYFALSLNLFFVAYQYSQIRNYDPHKCLIAFKNNNWIGILILLGSILGTIN